MRCWSAHPCAAARADALAFANEQRAPGKNLALHFEAVSQLEPDEQQVVLDVIEVLLLKHQAKRWGTTRRLGQDEPDSKRSRPAATASR